MKVALVGWTYSEHDLGILYNIQNILEIVVDDFKNFDLSYNRDFLKNEDTFDVVVLNYIFIATAEECKYDLCYTPDDPSIKVSELHSKENWKKRLLDSEAKQILIFGWDSFSEVTEKYIGSLDGYEMNQINLTHKSRVYGKVWKYAR
jgi:hypothetical protein